MSHTIALNFEDGVTRFIDANESESIADAARRAERDTGEFLLRKVLAERRGPNDGRSTIGTLR